ncbi:MAG: T9SS type A sorting domain-containing protein, partial [Candidatus Eisenbacteria sp.]|nr:T9SS type A sorting domain-containing protein [Candidatus Eisenbacteria bacterium]
GVMVYMSYARPDTIGGVGIEIGDLVSVRGTIEEYPSGGVPSVTEIAGPPDAYAPVVNIIQQDFGVPDPVRMNVHDFGTVAEDSANCERWEGVYCRVDTVVCTHWYEPLEYAEWAVVELEDFTGYKTTDTLRVDDKLVDPSLAKPDVGDTLKTISGIFSYEYGNYKLWPPSNDHVEYLSTPPAPNLLVAYSRNGTQVIVIFDKDVDETSSENTDNYSFEEVDVTSAMRWGTDPRKVTLTHTTPPSAGIAEQVTVCNVENMFGRAMPQCQALAFRIGVVPVSFVQTPVAGSDTSQVNEEMVTVGGICTGGSLTFGGFYLGTPGGGPYSGVYVFDSEHTAEVGDSVIVAALINEHYGLTELYLPEYVNSNLLTTTPPLESDVIDTWVLTSPSPGDTAEVWEGCLVKLVDVEVASYPSEYGEWDVHVGADTAHIDNGDYTYSASKGDTIDVEGPLDYAFDVWTIRPRDDDDIVVKAFGAVSDETIPLRVVELRNYPNPFNPKTVVEFGITRTTPVKLTVYDVNGRVVRTLVEEEMDMGTYQVLWNGKDSNGHAVAAGVYYCRLEAGDRLEMKKLVLVK